MTKNLIFIFLLSNYIGICCTCRHEGFSYEFYKTLENNFIGTVTNVKSNKQKFENEYTFRIKHIYKGKFDTIVQVKSGTGGGDCGQIFELNKTYLIDASFDKKDKSYHTSRCRFNALKGTKEFSEDTMLLNLFSKKNVYVNLPNMRGQIKDGKAIGFWVMGGDSGIYVNGKINGLWKGDDGPERYYKNSKLIKSVDFILNDQKNDSAKVVYGNKQSILYYPNGRTHKIITAKSFIIYYPNGNIKEKVKLNHHHFMYGYWYKYDETGKVIDKKFIENDNSEDAFWHFDGSDVF